MSLDRTRASFAWGSRQWLSALVMCVIAMLYVAPAFGADIKSQCIDAHEKTQSLRRAGQLRAARASALLCVRPVCPAVLQNECGPWLEQLSAAQPSIVLSVRDETGVEVTHARVTLDDEIVADALGGRAVDVDPGEHKLRVEVAGAHSLYERTLTFREGEQRRQVRVDLASRLVAPVVPTPPPAPSSARHIGAWFLGGAGVAALGVGVALAIAQNGSASDAHSACGPCSLGSSAAGTAMSDVSAAKTERVWEGVSFGLSGVALAAATYLFVVPATSPSESLLPKPTVSMDASAHGGAVYVRFPLP